MVRNSCRTREEEQEHQTMLAAKNVTDVVAVDSHPLNLFNTANAKDLIKLDERGKTSDRNVVVRCGHCNIDVLKIVYKDKLVLEILETTHIICGKCGVHVDFIKAHPNPVTDKPVNKIEINNPI